VLPFAAVLALLGVPAWLLVRRAARRRTEQPAPTEP
jgi:cytochrome c oxidase assembly factor CtaG